MGTLKLENYSIHQKERNRHGGIYAGNDLAFNPLDLLSHDNLEAK